MIKIKSPADISDMSVACAIVGETLDIVYKNIRAGIKTSELDDIAHQYILSKKALPSFKGYNGFPKSLCISINEELIHGIPGDRALKQGDIVGVDIGAYYGGYHGDAARSFIVGEGTPQNVKLVEVTKSSFFEALKYAKVGYRLGDISHAVQQCVQHNGYFVVREFCGHGIGRELHEPPAIPNYGSRNTGVKLVSGMTLAIEPMVLMEDNSIVKSLDGWTISSKNGLPTAHYENTILITDAEPVIMTATTLA